MTQTVVITGANRGIGLALVHEYLKRGENVIGLCRQSSPDLDASGAQVITGVDVTDDHSLHALADRLPDSVNILINNAGIMAADQLGDIDYHAIMDQVNVNTLGPLRITETLIDKLHDGAKVGLITSRMGSITDNTSGGYYGYRMSKAALNAAGMSLSHDLKERGIAVALLHPGFVNTDMVNHTGEVPPEDAAQRLAQRLDQLSLSNSGTFWHANGEVLPW